MKKTNFLHQLRLVFNGEIGKKSQKIFLFIIVDKENVDLNSEQHINCINLHKNRKNPVEYPITK